MSMRLIAAKIVETSTLEDGTTFESVASWRPADESVVADWIVEKATLTGDATPIVMGLMLLVNEKVTALNASEH